MYPNLMAELKRYEKNYSDIAKLLNIGLTTVKEKLSGKSDFRVGELKMIKEEWFPSCTLDYLSTTKSELYKNEENQTEEV